MVETTSDWRRSKRAGGVLLLCAGLLGARGAAFAAPTFEQDCRALVTGTHRLMGTDEHSRAFDHAAARLRGMNPDWTIEQPFVTAGLKTLECSMETAAGRRIPLHPMRPNGIVPPSTTSAGIAGRLVNVGRGTPEEYGDLNIEGAIAVIDYNCGGNWVRAFRLGAVGVVFVREGPLAAENCQFMEVNANLPRYFHDGPAATLPMGEEVVIRSTIRWVPVRGRNLLALFKGSDALFAQGKEEMIVLSAGLDNFGEVPELSPGARGAANVAALLQIAEQIAVNRPRRHVVIAIFDGQSFGHAGASRFHAALETDNARATVRARRESFDAEERYLASMRTALAADNPMGPSPVRRSVMNRLRDRATEEAAAVGERLADLRSERAALHAEVREQGDPDGLKTARIEVIATVDLPALDQDKDLWNELRRALGRDATDNLQDGVASRMRRIVDEVSVRIDARAVELSAEKEALDADADMMDTLGAYWMSLHASLALGDTTERWGLVIGAGSPLRTGDDNPGLYGKVQSAFLDASRRLSDAGRKLELFEQRSADLSLAHTRVLWAAPALIYGGEIAGMFGIYNLCFATCQEALPREGTPDDTLDALDLGRIERQWREIGRMLNTVASIEALADDADEPPLPERMEVRGRPPVEGVASQESLSLRRGIVANREYAMTSFSDDVSTGPTVMGVLPGTSVPNMPVAGAVVQLIPREASVLGFNTRKAYAFSQYQVMLSSRNGNYNLGPLPGGWWFWGVRGTAIVFDEEGMVRMISDRDTYGLVRHRLNVFECRSGWLAFPPLLNTSPQAAIGQRGLSALDNGELAIKKSLFHSAEGVLAWYTDRRESGVKWFGLQTIVALNTGALRHEENSVGEHPMGVGFDMGQTWTPFATARRSAVDLWRLTQTRMQLLQGRNIIDAALAELHGRAEDLLLATRDRPISAATEALDAAALMATRPVYTQTRRIVDDLVFSVLLLLGLAVPFAYAVERVVVGSTTVYKQIGWFAALFALTFLVLFWCHPAFAIAHTPVIIFLGFAVLSLSLVVIGIIMRRFRSELKALQGLGATVHASDISKIGTMLAAMQMGISTMRRRPMRTALTAVTIILLTFTILSFASFGTQLGILRLYAAPLPPYAGVWVHDVNWQPIGEDMIDVFTGRWGVDGEVFARRWISPQNENDPGVLLSREDGSQPLTMKGVLGISQGELTRREDLRATLGSELDGAVLMTRAAGRALGVREGDTVLMRGISLRVARLLDEVAVSTLSDMDGVSVLPVDFTEARSQRPAEVPVEETLVSPVNWTALPVDEVAIVSERTAARLGAGLRGLSVYTRDIETARTTAEDAARMLPMPVAGTLPHGVFRHVLGPVLAASGVRDLLFPILLGGLVIFGTMLGSVADREREIYTFSALGLAPRHVATLFFAESVVYSLIGGMGGYLLAQAVIRILYALAEHGWVRVPEMNMSSTNTIVTILIVMLTVLASAVYPAIKASRSANPGLMRSWRPPAPKGDVLEMVFPFTVSQYDITGVVSFLKEHFDNHRDTGLGRFMAAETRVHEIEKRGMAIDSVLTLAPFDLGVSQDFRLSSSPSEIPGIDEVHIRIERRSGQPKDWHRLNRVLLDDLRQQFLFWRSIPPETMEIYRHRTLTALGRACAGAPGETPGVREA